MVESGARKGRMSCLRQVVGCIAVVTALVALPGCSGSAPHSPPRGVMGCNHMFSIGDAGAGVGVDWDSDSHPYGDLTNLYVCDGTAATVTVDAPAGVSIIPTTARVDTAALLLFRVAVQRGA